MYGKQNKFVQNRFLNNSQYQTFNIRYHIDLASLFLIYDNEQLRKTFCIKKTNKRKNKPYEHQWNALKTSKTE